MKLKFWISVLAISILGCILNPIIAAPVAKSGKEIVYASLDAELYR